MKRFMILGGFLLGAALLAPIASADDRPYDHRQDRRYYDKHEKDYHVYNEHEDKAYRIYLGERHQNYREFRRLNSNEQHEYYGWRHSHPDDAIFKVVIR